jgi:hypothetical protein
LGYLFFDGSGDFMVTPTITPGTDKAQVFAGVRKLSDLNPAMLLELSTNFNLADGSFYFTAPEGTGARYFSISRGNAAGNTAQGASTGTSGIAPDSAVLTVTHDIAGDLSTISRNAVLGTSGTGDKGTGNFLANPLYIGARSGGSLSFSGQLFPLIVRFGPNLTTARISATESWVASKTAGVTL